MAIHQRVSSTSISPEGIVWAGAVGAAGWALGAALTGMLQRAAGIEELLGLGVVTALLFTFG